ncbi:MAG: hypothetical protein HXO20_02910 [Prevotella shahii]|nr:hypothetical protein [Hoylesella shahii]
MLAHWVANIGLLWPFATLGSCNGSALRMHTPTPLHKLKELMPVFDLA